MTALISWLAVDQRRPSSIYIASDSRISEPGKATEESARWNYAPKTFASRQYPDAFGFYGSVLLPTQILSQMVSLIDRGLIFASTDDVSAKFRKARKYIHSAYMSSGERVRGDFFEVLHVSREAYGMESQFYAARTTWNSKGSLNEQHLIEMPARSSLLCALGSGGEAVQKAFARWSKTEASGTSRAVFSAFCDAISGEEVATVGGPPQLVGLYRKDPALAFGLVWKNQRFVSGSRVRMCSLYDRVEWRNSLFERLDPFTGKLMIGAAAQARPYVLPAR